ncbi:hypothetical protein J3459_014786 [Metarhizium acridum]|nr:hypothetical protein J3459_014786 [Metarhizium acridum]
MAARLPISLSAALDISPSGAECSLELPTDIAFGAVSVGGYVACVMAKYAVLYASNHPKMRGQTDIRSSVIQFYRPLFAAKSAIMKLREVSVGKLWSTLRIEIFQGNDKTAVSADIMYADATYQCETKVYPDLQTIFSISDFSWSGIVLQTNWHLPAPPRPVDLSKLESDTDPGWASYQTAFYPDGFRRGSAYVRAFIPKTWPSEIRYIEQWICPGWDCYPQGSCAFEKTEDKARWTNDMIHFIMDSGLPIQENFFPHEPDKPLPMGSVAATLGFAAAQKKAREEGKQNWRALDSDGSKTMMTQTVHVTLSMSTEIKKKLPQEGVRWLYLWTETKSIINGRMDLQVLLFDETMDLVAVTSHVAQIIPAGQKNQRSKKGPSL